MISFMRIRAGYVGDLEWVLGYTIRTKEPFCDLEIMNTETLICSLAYAVSAVGVSGSRRVSGL